MRIGFGKRVGKFHVGTSMKIDSTWVLVILPFIAMFYICYLGAYVMYYMLKGIILGTYYLCIWLCSVFTRKNKTFDMIINEHRKKHEYSYDVLPKNPDDDFKGFNIEIPGNGTVPPPIVNQCDKSESVDKECTSKPITEKKKRGRPVLQLNDNLEIIKRFETVSDAAKETGINAKGIRDTAKGRQKHSGGFVWRYDDE